MKQLVQKVAGGFYKGDVNEQTLRLLRLTHFCPEDGTPESFIPKLEY